MFSDRKMWETWKDWRLEDKELISEKECCGNCKDEKVCCSITEDVKHITRAKKLVQVLQKDESRIRLHMWEMVEQMSKDEVNKKLGNNLKDSYKKNVTKFKIDMIKLVRKIK